MWEGNLGAEGARGGRLLSTRARGGNTSCDVFHGLNKKIDSDRYKQSASRSPNYSRLVNSICRSEGLLTRGREGRHGNSCREQLTKPPGFILKGSKKQCTCRRQSNDDRNILRQSHIESYNLRRLFGLIKVGGKT